VAASGHTRLARSAGLAGAATLVSRILGLARDQVLASLFGASNEMDAFIVASRIPNLVRDLFAEGAMSAAFVPTFTRHLAQHGKADAWRLANNVLTALLLVTGAFAAAGILFAGPLVTLYAGDFAGVPGKIELTIALTRAVLPFLPMVAVAAAAMGMLNSLNHYFVPALSPALFNAAMIVCALALAPLMPALGFPRIMAIAIGALLGGLGQIAVQWPPLRREGFRYRPLFDPGDPGLRAVLLLMGPGTLGLAATQINTFVNTLLATSQGPGAVSWLTYAFRLMYLPIGLFAVSIGTAVLPAVSQHAARDDTSEIRRTIARGLALMLMLNVPATLGLIALARPIVQLIYERGRFLPVDTDATAAALRVYAVGLVGYSTARIVSPTFYALGRSRVPVAVSAIAMTINVVLNVALVRVMGFRGLALGTSIAAFAHALMLVWLLRRRLHGIDGARLLRLFVNISIAAGVMAAVAAVVQTEMSNAVTGSGALAQSVRLGAAIGSGMLALVATAKLMAIDEFAEALTMVRLQVRKLLDRQ